jgi:hypothetical protein
VNWDFDEGGHLWRVPAAGGTPERLTTEAAFWQQPALSPDGRRIVAIRGPARAYVDAITQGVPLGARELVWIPAAGGEATFIRGRPGDSRAPTSARWAEDRGGGDGPHLRLRAGGALVSFRWDGTDERTHLRVTGPAAVGGTGSPPASLVLMSPRGGEALAQHGLQLYTVHVPERGGRRPTVSVANPDNAAFPVRRLTDMGGQFATWSADGRRVHWSIGNAHVVYDLEAARAHEDSVEADPPAGGSGRPGPADDPVDPDDPDAGAGGGCRRARTPGRRRLRPSSTG